MNTYNIKDICFGKENIQFLVNEFKEEIEINDTKIANDACYNFFLIQMELVFKKNHDKIIRSDSEKIISKINEKVYNSAIKQFTKYAKSTQNYYKEEETIDLKPLQIR
jgi:hypothetical protein